MSGAAFALICQSRANAKRSRAVERDRKRAAAQTVADEPPAKLPCVDGLHKLKTLLFKGLQNKVLKYLNTIDGKILLEDDCAWEDVAWLSTETQKAVQWQKVQEILMAHRALKDYPVEKTKLPQGGVSPSTLTRPEIIRFVCEPLADFLDNLPAVLTKDDGTPRFDAQWTWRATSKSAVKLRAAVADVVEDVKHDVVQVLSAFAVKQRVAKTEERLTASEQLTRDGFMDLIDVLAARDPSLKQEFLVKQAARAGCGNPQS